MKFSFFNLFQLNVSHPIIKQVNIKPNWSLMINIIFVDQYLQFYTWSSWLRIKVTYQNYVFVCLFDCFSCRKLLRFGNFQQFLWNTWRTFHGRVEILEVERPFIVRPPCLRAQQIRLSRKVIPICKVITLYKFCDFLLWWLGGISLIICLLIYRLGLKVRESLSFLPPAEERILRWTAARAHFVVNRKVTKSAS